MAEDTQRQLDNLPETSVPCPRVVKNEFVVEGEAWRVCGAKTLVEGEVEMYDKVRIKVEVLRE